MLTGSSHGWPHNTGDTMVARCFISQLRPTKETASRINLDYKPNQQKSTWLNVNDPQGVPWGAPQGE